MRLLGKILYGVVLAILLSVAGLFVVSLIPSMGVEVKIVKSGSMEPAIPTGSLVVVRPAETYVVGDVITFGKDTKTQIPTTHRIESIRQEGGTTFYTTKGDANEEHDPQEAAASDVIGKVLAHVPYAGYVLDFARQPLGFVLLIGLPAAMIIIDEAVNIIKETLALVRRRKNKNKVAGVVVEEIPEEPSNNNRFVQIPKI